MLFRYVSAPANAQTTTAIQGIPITSVCSPTKSIATNAAASHGNVSEPSEQRERPGDERQAAEEAGLDGELGVRRLARQHGDLGALGRHARVADPEAPRVVDRGACPGTEAREVLTRRGLVGTRRVIGRSGMLVRVRLLLGELGRREVRPGTEVVVGLHERKPEHGDDHREAGGKRGPPEHREDEQADDECEERGARVRREQGREEQNRERRRPPPAAERQAEQRHDQQVARRERREKRRGEPAEDHAAAFVVDEVLGQPREAAVGEPELVAEPARRLAPPGERYEVDVDETVGGNRRGSEQHRPAEPGALRRGQPQPPAEEVREHRQQVVPRAVEDALVRRAAAEHRLRDQRIRDDEGAEEQREPIDQQQLEVTPAQTPEDDRERTEQQQILPGGNGRQPPAAHARAVELRHDEVVQRQPDDQDVQRPDRTASLTAHAGPTAISVIPLLSTRTL